MPQWTYLKKVPPRGRLTLHHLLQCLVGRDDVIGAFVDHFISNLLSLLAEWNQFSTEVILDPPAAFLKNN